MTRMEILISMTLRTGVIVSSLLVLSGGLWYILKHLGTPLEVGAVNSSGSNAISLIKAGILVLVFTPIARVALSILLFLKERDWLFVLITLWVLVVLLFSLYGPW